MTPTFSPSRHQIILIICVAAKVAETQHLMFIKVLAVYKVPQSRHQISYLI